jgi:hypothetical protein
MQSCFFILEKLKLLKLGGINFLKKNKILYIIDILDSIGGAEKNLCQIVENINREIFTPIICCLRGGTISTSLSQKGIQVIL